ncbi:MULTISPECIES: sensor histidine kinase [Arenibacter]|uniref:sensor histidine kinase n=1 Tax=Arenibacter TaxID=178469 RepID=UPI0012FFE642|nr:MULTISPECIES: sensor histidine kinase [Arenibacter]
MNKIITALKYATAISISVNIFGIILGSLLTTTNNALSDYKEVGPAFIFIVFIPCFFSIYFTIHKEIDNLKILLKSFVKAGIASFSLVYISVYFILRFYRHIDISFFQSVSLFNAIISVFITLFFFLLLYRIKNKKEVGKRHKVSIPYKVPISIWGIVTIIYIALVVFLGQGRISISIATSIALFGIISMAITYFISFQDERKNYVSVKTIINYTLNIFIFPYLILSITSHNESVLSIQRAFMSAVMIGPYFLFLTMFLHFYKLFQLNKGEKKHLEQIGVAANLKYQQLKSQLSPHFLFNNLSVLTGLIEEEPGKAVHFLENLSSIYRYFLTQEKRDLVKLEEELEFADKYMDLLQIRFEDAISYNSLMLITVPKNCYILPLSLQQVFENVVKHNEISTGNPMEINLYIEDDYLAISNSLIPKKQMDLSEKVGLKNIRNRYSFFTDKKISVSSDNKNYVIKLPLLKIED